MKNPRAFTLIELLIVISVIGILAVAFVPQLLNSPSMARDTKRIEDVRNIFGVMVAGDQEAIMANALVGTSPSGESIPYSCIGNLVLDEADFGGVLPEDPGGISENHTLVGQLCVSPIYEAMFGGGGYWISGVFSGSHNYSWVVAAGVENPENANIDCENIVVGPSEPTEGEEYGCYALFIE